MAMQELNSVEIESVSGGAGAPPIIGTPPRPSRGFFGDIGRNILDGLSAAAGAVRDTAGALVP